MKQHFFNLLPPLTIGAVLVFWANVPEAGLDHRWALMLIILFEFGQYWMYRAMHNNSWLWAPQHYIAQLNAMKGYFGNPIELFPIRPWIDRQKEKRKPSVAICDSSGLS